MFKKEGNLRIDMCSNDRAADAHSSILYQGTIIPEADSRVADKKEMWTYDHSAKVVHEVVADVETEDLESAAVVSFFMPKPR